MSTDTQEYKEKAEDALKDLTSGFIESKNNHRSFLKHTTLIIATIIGFSVAFYSQPNSSPHFFIIVSLGLMLFSLFLGMLLIREDIDFQARSNFISSKFQYNSNMILALEKNGEIKKNSEEYEGLVIANLVQNVKENFLIEEKIFNQTANKIAEKWKEKLPFDRYLLDKKGYKRWEDPIQILFIKQYYSIVKLYYLLIIISFGLMWVGAIIK